MKAKILILLAIFLLVFSAVAVTQPLLQGKPIAAEKHVPQAVNKSSTNSPVKVNASMAVPKAVYTSENVPEFPISLSGIYDCNLAEQLANYEQEVGEYLAKIEGYSDYHQNDAQQILADAEEVRDQAITVVEETEYEISPVEVQLSCPSTSSSTTSTHSYSSSPIGGECVTNLENAADALEDLYYAKNKAEDGLDDLEGLLDEINTEIDYDDDCYYDMINDSYGTVEDYVDQVDYYYGKIEGFVDRARTKCSDIDCDDEGLYDPLDTGDDELPVIQGVAVVGQLRVFNTSRGRVAAPAFIEKHVQKGERVGSIVNKTKKGKPVLNIVKQRKTRILGIVPVEMEVETIVDAETGDLVEENKPWWSFLTSKTS